MRVLTQLHRPSQNLFSQLTHRIQIQTQTATLATKTKKLKRRPDAPKPLPAHYADPATTPIIRTHITHRKSLATPPIPFSTQLLEKQKALQQPQTQPSSSNDDDKPSTTTTDDNSNPPLLYDFTSLKPTMSPKLLRLFHLTNANSYQLARARKARAIQLFQKRDGDTGSSAAQIVALTSRIQQMQTHMGTHRKDFSGKRGLDALYVRRRKMLDYLERKDFDTYRVVVRALNLVR